MEYKQKHRSQQPHSSDLTSVPLQQRQQADQVDSLQRKQTELRQAMQPLVSTPIIVQRRSISPIFQAVALQQTEEQSLSSKQESIQRKIDHLGEIPKDALGPALQRQLMAETPLPAIKNPRTVDDLVVVMRQRAAALDGRFIGERDRMHFNTLQRHVAVNIDQAYRKDRQSSEARNTQYGEILASLHDHPGSKAVSRAVLNMIPKSDQPRLQRALDKALQRKQEQAELDEKALELHALQKKQAELKEEADQSIFERIQAKKGGGQPLSKSVRQHLEQGLNQDLSKVRIHDDAEADKLAKSVNAIAFTTGTDIFFQSGKYDPNSQTGLELLAHEVTHTVQQSKGQVAKGIDPDAGLEQEAQNMGKKLAVSLSTGQASAIKTNPLQRPTSQIARVSGGLQRKTDQNKQDPADLQAGKKINKPGIVSAKEGANIRSAPEPNAQLVKHLPFNSHLVVQAEMAGGWSRVITADGQMGYTATRFLKHNLPEPSAKLHLVTEGQTALSIAQRYYSGQTEFGYDHRDFVIVLAALNPKSLVGTFNPEQWQEAKFKANFHIWIPSAEFMQGMKGKYRSSSLTIRGVKAAQQTIVDQLNPLAIAGGIAGLVEGFFLQAWDTIKGVFDFVKSIFTGEIINQAKALWQAIQNLDISKLIDHAGQAAGVALDKYNKAGAFERGRMLGKLVGRIVFEIVLGILTAGAATVASGLLRGIPAIAKFIRVLQKAKQAGKLAVGTVKTTIRKGIKELIPTKVFNRLSNRARKQADEALDSSDAQKALREGGQKAKELPVAIAMATGMVATNDQIDTPKAALRTQLLGLKAKFKWIKGFSFSKGKNKFDVYLIASKIPVYKQYTIEDNQEKSSNVNEIDFDQINAADLSKMLRNGEIELPDSVFYRISKTDKKGRPFGSPGNPQTPSVLEFNPRVYDTSAGDIKIGSTLHGTNSRQGGPISKLSNAELIQFRLEDPISSKGFKNGEFNVTGGHHRFAEIQRRIAAGSLPKETKIRILLHD